MKIIYDNSTLDIIMFDAMGTIELDEGQSSIDVAVAPDSLDNYTIENREEDGVDNYVLVRKTDADITAQQNNNKWELVRQERAKLLKDTDWTQSADSPLTDSKKTEWATYRQSLRDVTNQSDPFNVTWPTEPD